MFDVPLYLSLAGVRFADRARQPRELLDWASSTGVRGLVLDAAMPSLRPRELDRSARRDLAALLRRGNLGFGGLDLWIPPEHFAQAEHADRAIAAVLAACDLASELARLLDGPQTAARVNLEFPEKRHADVDRVLLSAELHAAIADHHRPPAPAPSVVPGIDPAAILMTAPTAPTTDPIAALTQAAGKHPTARLSDASSVGRTVPGSGRLDLQGYKLAAAAAGVHAAILDLRGLDNAQAAIEKVIPAWDRF